MPEGYQGVDNNEVGQVRDVLEALVTEGARRMLESALEEEVRSFLGRDRYQRRNEFRGYRNRYHRSREITVGLNPVRVKVPRVSEVPTEVSTDGFTSQIVHRYERLSKKTQQLFRKLYLEGLATGDFEPVFRELGGDGGAVGQHDSPAESDVGGGLRGMAQAILGRSHLRLHLVRWDVSGSWW